MSKSFKMVLYSTIESWPERGMEGCWNELGFMKDFSSYFFPDLAFEKDFRSPIYVDGLNTDFGILSIFITKFSKSLG